MRNKHPLNMTRQRRKFNRRPSNNQSGGGGGGGGRGAGHVGYEDDHPESVSPRQRQHAKNAREKYINLGRDAAASGNRVEAEYYFQHADHYTRVLNLAQQQYESRMRDRYPDERGERHRERSEMDGGDADAYAAGDGFADALQERDIVGQ